MTTKELKSLCPKEKLVQEYVNKIYEDAKNRSILGFDKLENSLQLPSGIAKEIVYRLKKNGYRIKWLGYSGDHFGVSWEL